MTSRKSRQRFSNNTTLSSTIGHLSDIVGTLIGAIFKLETCGGVVDDRGGRRELVRRLRSPVVELVQLTRIRVELTEKIRQQEEARASLDKNKSELAKQIEEWEKTSETGDRAELSELPENSVLWPKLDARRWRAIAERVGIGDAPTAERRSFSS